MSKDIPIIFSAPMVRALLDGRKSMTRRIMKLPTKNEYIRPDMGGWAPTTVGGGSSFVVRRDGTREAAPEIIAIWNQTTGTCVAARHQIGDRLWVRETVACGACAPSPPSTWSPSFWRREQGSPENRNGLWYAADGLAPRAPITSRGKWVPAIHMPRWVSRLTLVLTGVKIERLQDISDGDIIAEGAVSFNNGSTMMFGIPVIGGYEHAGLTARETFWNLWCSLNGPHAWNENPFVVASSFRVIKANIDAPEARLAA